MSDAITNLKLDFSSSPTLWKFLQDKSFVRGVMGPVGSGNSPFLASASRHLDA